MEATAIETSQTAEAENAPHANWPQGALDLIVPVATEEGFGEDPKYTSEFEIAKLEIEKGASIDWEAIQLNCQKLSLEIAKDLRALGYLALSSFRASGVSHGCEALLAITHYILEHFEKVHPQRETAKLNSISWLNSDKLTAFLEGLSPEGADKPIAFTTLQELNKVKKFLTEKYPDNPPSIGQLVKVFEAWVKNYEPVSAKEESIVQVSEGEAETGNPEQASAPANGKMGQELSTDVPHTNGVVETETKVEAAPDPDWVIQLKKPISDGAPTGEDPKYSNEFDVIKAEIEKMSGNDFELLVNEGLKVLTEQAKDLRVFGFLLLGSIKSEGIEHFSYVLDSMAYWAESDFEGLHPQRETAKENAIKWLNQDRLMTTMDGVEPKEAYYPHVMRAQQAFNKLKSVIFEKFPDNPPSIGQLGKALEKWVKSSKPAPVAATKPAATASASSPAESTSTTSTASSAGPALGAIEDISGAQTNLQKVASFFLANDETNPLGYKLMRVLKWETIPETPNIPNGVLRIAGPNAQLKNQLEKMLETQNWKDLVRLAEEAFTRPGHHFWLDLQWYSCQALRGLGGKYNLCAGAIEGELASLMKRAGGLAEFKYQDNTAFASPRTLDWVAEISAAAAGGTGVSKTSDGLSDEDKETMNGLVAEGKLPEVLAFLENAPGNLDKKTTSMRKIQMAKICVNMQNPLLAEGIWSGVKDELERDHSGDWDKNFASTVYEMGLRIYKLLSTDAGSGPAEKAHYVLQMRDCYKKIAKFDPIKANQLNF